MTHPFSSRHIQSEVEKFTAENGRPPRVLLLSETEGTLGHARIASVLAQRVREIGGEMVVASGDISEEPFDFGGSLRKLPLVIHHFENGQVKERTPKGTLYDEDAAYQQERKDALLEIMRDFRPDVVAMEFHPFSWKGFRVPDVEAMRAYREEVGGKLPFVTIARDDTSTRTTERIEQALEDFDHVFIKGWEGVQWEDAKPIPDKVKEKTEYVGHVLADLPTPDNLPPEERPVMVFSSGGHHQQDELFFDKALEACAKGAFPDRPWKIVVSQKCPQAVFDGFCRKAEEIGPGRISVERVYASKDFSRDIANCEAAIVRGSYDVTLELLAQGKPFVVVPRSVSGFSRENTGRAEFFEKERLATKLTEAELGAEDGADKLVAKLHEATRLPTREVNYDNGSQFAARLLRIAMQAKQKEPKQEAPWAERCGDSAPRKRAAGY